MSTQDSQAMDEVWDVPSAFEGQTIHWQRVHHYPQLPHRQTMRRWMLKALGDMPAEITVRFVDKEEGRALNHDYRHKDYATNVLTFDYSQDPVMADVVICVPVLEEQAIEQNKPFKAHLAHLLVHAALHALGYDHIEDDEAEAMEALETEILTSLKFDPPYADRRDGTPIDN